jgi:alanine dehydrogenase
MEQNKSVDIPSGKECMIPQEEMLMIGRKKKKLVIGLPNEIERFENRLCLSPQAVEYAVENGHVVYVEKGAGVAANYSDEQYSARGAIIVDTKEEIYKCDIILKVAPFTKKDIEKLKGNQVVISSFHIYDQSADSIREMIKKKITAVAFDYYKDCDGCYAFIRSMGEIAGYSSIMIASEYLSNSRGGKGIMLGGITGVAPSEVVVLGAGTAGENAARTALGLGAVVKIFDYSIKRLRRIEDNLGQRVFTSIMHPPVLEKALMSADVVLGAVRCDDGQICTLVTEDMVKKMKPGSIIIDLSIDRGGCVETSQVTSLRNPVFTKHKVIHYCVPNIASRVSRTSTIALSNIFMPLLKEIGEAGGITQAIKADYGLRHGVYMYNGILTNSAIGDKFGILSRDIDLLMAAL